MLILQDLTYIHPNGSLLFANLDLILNKQDKIALIGNNGTGKSTLLKIMAGELNPSGGLIKVNCRPYYVPQLFGQFNDYSIARAIGIADKLHALKEILEGNVSTANLALLNDDWALEERCQKAFNHWGLANLDLTQKMNTLSGGQKAKVFLAGITIHRPEIVLLDEPGNHLDTPGRKLLYDYITSTKNTLVVVSHDRALLNLIHTVYELDKQNIKVYGGNYDFYAKQKAIEREALGQDLKNKEKAFRKAKEIKKETLERQQKLDARGKKKQEKAGLPVIVMNTLKDNAQKSTSRLKGIHAEKTVMAALELAQLRSALPDADKMKVFFDNSVLRHRKTLVSGKELNFRYNDQLLWKKPLTFQINGTDRIVIEGGNGSGKTTLMKMILGTNQPSHGIFNRADFKAIYIDQDYSLIDNKLTVYGQAQYYNSGALQEHEIKTRLNRFLFTSAHWDKPCKTLSGGEKMRLMLCSLTINNQAPDMIMLDEPTNNLDMQNTEILMAAVNEYKGTLLIVSHDEYFLKRIKVERAIAIDER